MTESAQVVLAVTLGIAEDSLHRGSWRGPRSAQLTSGRGHERSRPGACAQTHVEEPVIDPVGEKNVDRTVTGRPPAVVVAG
ncbi:hypothetical protein GCM10023175_43190 [Pseudonocardia xishanensis]|uniref:Uncharacterized protein n=1 Tax=Pseudonocardia xishanensis TaxID=630995 RepID=A0ABP8RVU2_9PSEU